MHRFNHYNYDQDTMVVINCQEQLQPGTFEHAVHYLIEYKLDLSVFHPKYRNDDTGRLAYDPAILLNIILFAYSRGITSSREMQWCCETNIIFKALSCNTVPHFTTLAKFVSSHADEMEELFEQVLLACKICIPHVHVGHPPVKAPSRVITAWPRWIRNTSRSPQRFRSTGVLHRREQTPVQLHRLD